MNIKANAGVASGAAELELDLNVQEQFKCTNLRSKYQAQRKSDPVFCAECGTVTSRKARQQLFCCANCRLIAHRRKIETNRDKTTNKNNHKDWQEQYQLNRFARQITKTEFGQGRHGHKWGGR